VVIIRIVVLWLVTPCRVVGRHRSFEGTCFRFRVRHWLDYRGRLHGRWSLRCREWEGSGAWPGLVTTAGRKTDFSGPSSQEGNAISNWPCFLTILFPSCDGNLTVHLHNSTLNMEETFSFVRSLLSAYKTARCRNPYDHDLLFRIFKLRYSTCNYSNLNQFSLHI
jgi:hypothetical protein